MNFLSGVMLNNDLLQQIKGNFPYEPTEEQEITIKFFVDFLFSPKSESVLLLKGYAGTGKTTLISALVKTIRHIRSKCVLLAPTGRAAKVFAQNASHPAYTIHKKIYRQKTFSNEMDNFQLAPNLHRDTLFIVDEASMISDSGGGEAHFGSGHLLNDLIEFVYSGDNCKLMMIGDTAQLPPVGENESPALSRTSLAAYGFKVDQVELTEVVRQRDTSGILANATAIRDIIRAGGLMNSIRQKGGAVK